MNVVKYMLFMRKQAVRAVSIIVTTPSVGRRCDPLCEAWLLNLGAATCQMRLVRCDGVRLRQPRQDVPIVARAVHVMRVGVRHATVHLTEMSSQRPELLPRMHCVRADIVVWRHVDDLRLGVVRYGECYRLATLVGDSAVVDEHVTPCRRTPQVEAFVRAECQQVQTVRRETQTVDVAIVGRVYWIAMKTQRCTICINP